MKSMKKNILVMSIGIVLTGIALTGCQNSAHRSKNAKENLMGEKISTPNTLKGMDQEQQNSVTAFQKFKEESEAKIDSYQETITEIKAEIAKKSKKDKTLYNTKLAVIEQKTNELKMKLEDYKDNGQSKWGSFKNEFNHDMGNLGNALKGFFTNSKK